MTMLTYDNWESGKVHFPIDNEGKGSLQVLEWAYAHYGDEILYACSFGAEGVVLIDLIHRVNPRARVVFLDTGLHFQETHDVIRQVKERYPRMRIDMLRPQWTVEEQAARWGEALWKRSPDQCCRLRKIEPLSEALTGVKAWISGLRRDQSPSRRFTQFVNKDERFRKIKICPLIHWTWEDVWMYIRRRDLPYNRLHDRGYPSIGCAPCTRPSEDPGDPRSGRWAGFQKTECGLHSS